MAEAREAAGRPPGRGGALLGGRQGHVQRRHEEADDVKLSDGFGPRVSPGSVTTEHLSSRLPLPASSTQTSQN